MWRGIPFSLSIAAAPEMTALRPARTWSPTIVRNTGDVDGIAIPKTEVAVCTYVFPVQLDAIAASNMCVMARMFSKRLPIAPASTL